MATAPFEASKAVTFDLAIGEIRLDDERRRMLVGADALLRLCETAGPEASSALGRALGEPIGRRVAGDSEEPPPASAPRRWSRWSTICAGEWALRGLGALSLERWGRALVAVVDHPPWGEGGDRILESVLGEALGHAVGREVSSVRLGRDAGTVFASCSRVRERAQGPGVAREGVPWAEAVVRVHAAPETAGER